MYTVEQEQEDLEQESVSSIQQSLLLYVFLQHGDPFASELSDMMGERQLTVQSQIIMLKLVFVSSPLLCLRSSHSHRGADTEPPGGYSEQQQAGRHKSPTDWAEGRTESPTSKKTGRSTYTTTAREEINSIMYCSVFSHDINNFT